MSRYRTFAGRDDPQALEMDNGLVGIDMNSEPSTLQPGLGSYANNKRFSRKVAATRSGVITPVFANSVRSGQIYGSGVYSDPDGEEWLMLAVADRIWFHRDGRYPRAVMLDAGLTITDTVDLVQGFENVVCFRGVDQVELEWDGVWTGTFTTIDQTGTGGTEAIPNAETGVVFKNRMIVKQGRDELAVSDILNYTRYVPVLDEFRINSGSDDSIVCSFPHTETSLLVFKDQSIYLVQNIYGDLTDVSLTELTREIGLKARDSVVRFGADVLFLSDTGVFALSETSTLKLHADSSALSDPIVPLMKRINWGAAGKAQGIGYGDYYYLAVPLDGSEVNNAVLVFNTRTKMWEGFDSWPLRDAPGALVNFQIDRFHITDWLGRKRLYAVDRFNNRVIVMYEGVSDILGNTGSAELQIVDEFWTRGYSMGHPKIKRFSRGSVKFLTNNPRLTLAAATDGINEDKAIFTDRTKSRVIYYLHGQPAYDPSNINNDHTKPRRQDYSLHSGTPWNPLSGINPNLKQEAEERFTLNLMGHHVILKVIGESGNSDIAGLTVEEYEAQRDERTKA